ncbi:ComGF family competence protein [Companilactobacillus halodurans]|uniref:Competence protein ComGF n=1 Tax=Companilactobacillus halodurans TaxID=2584183 RepID=A0A5P0ZYZ9_9LACO|nr:ComGF family competence protein [Companilactobacillus halodurans]MQS98115.1 hypothetical protein [Companilactobacillus halodurans]
MFTKWNSKRDGFVLYEAVLSLMITIMTLGILQQSLQLLKTIQRVSFRDPLRWHISYEKLDSILSQNELVEIDNNKIIYKNKNDKNLKWVVEKYGSNILRLTAAVKGGHEPIFTNLDTDHPVTIEKIQNLVIITTVNKAGQKSQMCFINDP